MQNNDYIEKIREIIGFLDENEKSWRQCIKDNDESQIIDLGSFREYIADLLYEIKEYIKCAGVQGEARIRDLLQDSLLSGNLLGQVYRMLVHYRAMAPLRILEADDVHLCQEFLSYAMENYISRLDIKCLNQFEHYKFQNYEEMQKCLESLDILAGYYVLKSFSTHTIEEDFGDESGLSEAMCNYYANLVNENYLTIKLNMIVQKVNLLEKKIDQL